MNDCKVQGCFANTDQSYSGLPMCMQSWSGTLELRDAVFKDCMLYQKAALAAQQNSPSADTFEQPFKEGAGVSEDTPTSALGGLSEGEVKEVWAKTFKEKYPQTWGVTEPPDLAIRFARAIEAALRSASRRTEEK